MPSPQSKTKPSLKKHDIEFEAIGTHWKIELFGKSVNEIDATIKARIGEFDKSYSRFRADSLVTKMSRLAGKYSLPADAKPMLDLYWDLYRFTDGMVTPLIGQALSDAGYDANYSFKPSKLNQTPNWEDCMVYEYPDLTIKKPIMLDFGALGKGYLVDIIGRLMSGAGYKEFIINAGGDILHRGPKPVQIALEHPENTDQAVGIAAIKGQALCGSAGNRRAWAGYTHILNPRKLSSPKHIAAVWVCAGSAMLADAMTTALYFADPAELLKRYNFSYAIIDQDHSLIYSKVFPAKFFENEGE